MELFKLIFSREHLEMPASRTGASDRAQHFENVSRRRLRPLFCRPRPRIARVNKEGGWIRRHIARILRKQAASASLRADADTRVRSNVQDLPQAAPTLERERETTNDNVIFPLPDCALNLDTLAECSQLPQQQPEQGLPVSCNWSGFDDMQLEPVDFSLGFPVDTDKNECNDQSVTSAYRPFAFAVHSCDDPQPKSTKILIDEQLGDTPDDEDEAENANDNENDETEEDIDAQDEEQVDGEEDAENDYEEETAVPNEDGQNAEDEQEDDGQNAEDVDDAQDEETADDEHGQAAEDVDGQDDETKDVIEDTDVKVKVESKHADTLEFEQVGDRQLCPNSDLATNDKAQITDGTIGEASLGNNDVEFVTAVPDINMDEVSADTPPTQDKQESTAQQTNEVPCSDLTIKADAQSTTSEIPSSQVEINTNEHGKTDELESHYDMVTTLELVTENNNTNERTTADMTNICATAIELGDCVDKTVVNVLPSSIIDTQSVLRVDEIPSPHHLPKSSISDEVEAKVGTDKPTPESTTGNTNDSNSWCIIC